MTTRILVVDDVAEIGVFFARTATAFRVPGVEVRSETDPAAAMEILGHERFDVVVSDFRMPEIDGIVVLRRAFETNPGGKRVLMTGYNEVPATKAEVDAAHLSAILKKPVRALHLGAFLRACTNGPNALQGYWEVEVERG